MQTTMSEWLLPRMLARVSGPGAGLGSGGTGAPELAAAAGAARDTAAATADRLELIGLIEAGADRDLVRDMLALAANHAESGTRRQPRR
ncbi:MAG: hypothetical protein M5U35_13830 [Roseovarius sp.]|nr:hypothetical protein [Roseovarius sp.]